MSAHSLGGRKKTQFLLKQGDYGMRVSRRGYGDTGEPMDQRDFLNLYHKRKTLKHNYKMLSSEMLSGTCTYRRRSEIKSILRKTMHDLEKLNAVYNACDFAEEKEILEGSTSFHQVFFKLAKRHLDPDEFDSIVKKSKEHWDLVR